MSEFLLVDSHCHLNDISYEADRESVLQRARAEGVTTFLTICTKLSDVQEIFLISQADDSIYCSVGVHPHEAQEAIEKGSLYEELTNLGNHNKVIGLGETGLDYYYEHSPKEAQKSAFSLHIQAALALDLPLIVHTREAEEDTIALLSAASPKVRGVIHCFSGTQALADAALGLGFYVSISGIITFKNAENLREIVKTIPIDRLLLETDAPYLAPIPYRGKRNEPAFMTETAKTVAMLKGVSIETLAQQTTENFYRLFNRAEKKAT